MSYVTVSAELADLVEHWDEGVEPVEYRARQHIVELAREIVALDERPFP